LATTQQRKCSLDSGSFFFGDQGLFFPHRSASSFEPLLKDISSVSSLREGEVSRTLYNVPFRSYVADDEHAHVLSSWILALFSPHRVHSRSSSLTFALVSGGFRRLFSRLTLLSDILFRLIGAFFVLISAWISLLIFNNLSSGVQVHHMTSLIYYFGLF